MAGEIRISATLTDALGTGNTATVSLQKSIDQTTLRAISNKQTVTTGGATIAFTGITTPRVILLTNLDATNFIDIGPDSSGLVGVVRLKPGEFCLLPLKPSVVLKAIADTGSVIIGFLIVET